MNNIDIYEYQNLINLVSELLVDYMNSDKKEVN